MMKETKQEGKERFVKEKGGVRKMKRYREKERGITLVALVITVIIIIILSTVVISFLFGENGLITKAQQAKLQHEIETARETLTMILGDAFVEKKINPEYNQDEFLDEFIKAREPNVYLEDAAIGLDGHVFGLDRSVPELGEYQGELTGPRIKEIKVTSETTNSASIEVVALNTEGATYEYWYKGNAEGEDQWKKVETDNKSNTCTISGLTQGEIYNVRVTITTKDGSATGEINVYLGEIPEGTITFTPAEWLGDGTARTTINTSETGYTLQYQIVVGDAEPVDTAWQTATSGQTIEGLHHNETVYGRLFDGTNESKIYATVEIKDTIVPSAPTISITSGTAGNNGYYKSNVTVTITGGNDGESGANQVRYSVSGAQTIAETTTAEGTTSTSITISTDGTSTITAYTIDKAGNISTAVTQTINKDSTAPSTASLTVGTVGETSIAVTASGADSTSGIYSYQFQRSTTSTTTGFSTVGGTQTSTATSYSYTYSNLSDDTTYYLRVIVTDRAGNTRTSTVRTQKTNKSYPTASATLKAGDWVRYPSAQGGNIDCVVLYDSSSSYGVQLITNNCVENITLGEQSDNIITTKAKNDYNNVVSVLNSAANKYNNISYSTRARCVGSHPTSTSDTTNYYYISSPGISSYEGQFKDDDINYTIDFEQMTALKINDIGQTYWLASRYINPGNGEYYFTIRYVAGYFIPSWSNLFCIKTNDKESSSASTWGLRPIFILKPSIKVTGGTGEEGDPYTLGT